MSKLRIESSANVFLEAEVDDDRHLVEVLELLAECIREDGLPLALEKTKAAIEKQLFASD